MSVAQISFEQVSQLQAGHTHAKTSFAQTSQSKKIFRIFICVLTFNTSWKLNFKWTTYWVSYNLQDYQRLKNGVKSLTNLSDCFQVCITKTPDDPQVWLGSNKAFTYDFVYEPDSLQEEVYDETVRDLIEGCFEG